MSTEPPPLDDLDLSAFLDQEAGDDVAARIQADPAAQERLEQLRSVRDAVSSHQVTGLSPERVDALVTAALAAGDVDLADSADVGATPTRGPDEPPADPRAVQDVVPVPLTSARRRGVPHWAVAAVVVVLVGLGLTLVWSGRDARDDGADTAFSDVASSISAEDADESTAAALSEESESDAAASGEAEMAPGATASEPAEPAEEASTTTVAPGQDGGAPTLVYLGEFDDGDALRTRLRDGFPASGAGPMPDTGVDDDLTAAFRCLGKVDGLFEPAGDPTDVGLAMVAGEPTVVYDLPYRTDDGRDTTIVIAVDEVSCIPVVAFQR